jgi:hypothetical protein
MTTATQTTRKHHGGVSAAILHIGPTVSQSSTRLGIIDCPTPSTPDIARDINIRASHRLALSPQLQAALAELMRTPAPTSKHRQHARLVSTPELPWGQVLAFAAMLFLAGVLCWVGYKIATATKGIPDRTNQVIEWAGQ